MQTFREMLDQYWITQEYWFRERFAFTFHYVNNKKKFSGYAGLRITLYSSFTVTQ